MYKNIRVPPPPPWDSSPIVLVPKKMGRLDFALISASLTSVGNSMRNLCRIWRNLLIGCQDIGSIQKWICARGIGSLASVRGQGYNEYSLRNTQRLFKLKTMLFSSVNAGLSFCHLIRIVLQGLRIVHSFVDNM